MSAAQRFDAVVLGGGAAGLMCAAEAVKGGGRVLVLERAERLGKKILISGGGRCNFTNIHCTPVNFISKNPHFAKSALSRYTPSDFIELVERYRIPYHEKTLGQLFCDRHASDILTMLEKECTTNGVMLLVNRRVSEVARDDEGFVVRCAEVEYRCRALVVATGGLSIPKMGATGFGHEIARQFGLRLVTCRPGLVPLLFDPYELERFRELSGVSLEVIAKCDGGQFREKMLFTHRGLSGPAILQVSSYWQDANSSVDVDLLPERQVTARARSGTAERQNVLKSSLREFTSVRFAECWLQYYGPESWTNAGLEQFEQRLHAWRVHPAGTEGYDKAEVTVGGVDTDELSAKTMESRRVPGLFFIGEVVDVTGHLGGFNFQWAWASAVAAGKHIASQIG